MAKTIGEFKSIIGESDESALAHVRASTSSATHSGAAAIGAATSVAVATHSAAHAAATASMASPTMLANGPALGITPSTHSVIATYTFTGSGTSGDGAESGKAVITVFDDHTMTVALTSLTPNATSDGQNLASLQMIFATAPPAATIATSTGQLVDVDGHGGYTNVAGAITHWGTLTDAATKSLFLATAGTGAQPKDPIQLITDTKAGSSNANASFGQHQPEIADTATFTLSYTGTLPAITGVNFGFGTSPQSGGYTVPGTPTCYLEGTRIAVSSTASIEVENLKIGDLVLTSDGREVPVLWMGRQTVSRIFADPLRAMPIRIKAGALADNLPIRDLLVSTCHAILIDGVLVQAGALVNGVSIIRETDVPETFTYYHVELEDHSLILAEGVAAETFVDNVTRMGFDNWSEHEDLFPEGRGIAEIDLPRVTSARQLPNTIRDRLDGRAIAFGARILQAA